MPTLKIVEKRNRNPMVSTLLVLLALVVLQTLSINLDFKTFTFKLMPIGDWWNTFSTNWLNILRNNSYEGMIALGMTFVIISGGIDLAVGSTLVGVGALMMMMISTKESGILLHMGITGPFAVVITCVVGVLAGLALGEINGLLVSKGRIPPFIVTLGTMKIYRSVTQYFMQTQGVALPDEFKAISKTLIFGNQVLPIVYWFVLAAVLYLISRHTSFGRYVYAIGSNERTARLSGINVDSVKRRVYALMGVIVAIASIVQVARIGSMDFSSAGSGYEMNAIAAAIIGGTSMSGGRGSIIGTVLGMLILAVMNNLLTLIGVDPFLREAFKGAIVVIAVMLQRKEG